MEQMTITTTANTTTNNTNTDARITSESLFAAIDHAVKTAKNPLGTQAGRFVLNAVYTAAVHCIDAMASSASDRIATNRRNLDATLKALARLQKRDTPINADRLLFRLTRDSGDMLKVMGIGGFKSWLRVYTDDAGVDYTLPATVAEPKLPAPKAPKARTIKDGDTVRAMTEAEIRAYDEKRMAKLQAEMAKLQARMAPAQA